MTVRSISILPISLCALALLAAAPTFAQVPANTYRAKSITFTYPSGWTVLPNSRAASLGQTLSSAAAGEINLSAIAGVSETVKHQAGVAVVAKMAFTKKFQRQLKGHRELFIRRFEHGVSANAIQVLRKGKVHFGGQRADSIEILSASGAGQTRDAFYVLIAKDNRSVDVAILVAQPARAWGKFSAGFGSITRSSRFH